MKETILTIAEWHRNANIYLTLDQAERAFDKKIVDVERDPSFEALAELFIIACGVLEKDQGVGLDCLSIVLGYYGIGEAYGDWWTPYQEAIDKKMAEYRQDIFDF